MKKDYTNLIHAERTSITPSGFFGSSSKMIQCRENFLDDENALKVLNFVKTISFWDETVTKYNENGTIIYESEYWKDRVANESTINKQDPSIPPILHSFVKKLKKEVDEFYNVNAHPTNPALVRWLPGQFQNPHADKELHEGPDAGKPNDFPYFDIASLFYLNEDYEGGELYFPNQNIKIIG